MEGAFEKLEEIEKAYPEFFKRNNIHSIDYIFVSQSPLKLNFTLGKYGRNELPEEIRIKINNVIQDFNSKKPI